MRFLTKISALTLLAAGMMFGQAPGVPVTAPIGAGGNFPLINSPAVVFATDADHTMTYPEMSGSSGTIKVTSTPSLTATRNLVLPLTKGFQFTLINDTPGGQAIQPKGASGTFPPAIPNCSVSASTCAVTVATDGTNYYQVGAASSGFPLTLGSTSIAAGSTTTAVSGLSVNGVTLNGAGSSSLYLNQSGGYTTPSGGYFTGTPTVAVTGTPMTGQVLTATSGSAATFQTPAGSPVGANAVQGSNAGVTAFAATNLATTLNSLPVVEYINAPHPALVNWFQALHNARNQVVRLAIFGDSYVRCDVPSCSDGPTNPGNRWIEQMRASLNSLYGSAGTGFNTFMNQGNGVLDADLFTSSGTLTPTSGYGPYQTGTYAYTSLFAMAPGATITFTTSTPYAQINLMCLRTTSSGTITITIDGTPEGTACGTPAGSGVVYTKVSSTAVTLGAHTTVISCASAACYPYAIEGSTNTSGVVIDNWAFGGATSTMFGGDVANNMAWADLSPPNLAWFGLQTNDSGQGISTSTFTTNMTAAINNIAAVSTAPSIVLQVPPYGGIGTQGNAQLFAAAQLALAQTLSLDYVSVPDRMGFVYNSGSGLWNANHPNDKLSLDEFTEFYAKVIDPVPNNGSFGGSTGGGCTNNCTFTGTTTATGTVNTNSVVPYTGFFLCLNQSSGTCPDGSTAPSSTLSGHDFYANGQTIVEGSSYGRAGIIFLQANTPLDTQHGGLVQVIGSNFGSGYSSQINIQSDSAIGVNVDGSDAGHNPGYVCIGPTCNEAVGKTMTLQVPGTAGFGSANQSHFDASGNFFAGGNASVTGGFSAIGTSAFGSSAQTIVNTSGQVTVAGNNHCGFLQLGTSTDCPTSQLLIANGTSEIAQEYMSGGGSRITDQSLWDVLPQPGAELYRMINDANTLANSWLTVNRSGYTPTSAQFASGMAVGWATDTGLSRTAAGVVAVGNGTAGNASGTLNLNLLNASGTVAGANVTATASITDAALTVGQCVFASTGGVLQSTGAPCYPSVLKYSRYWSIAPGVFATSSLVGPVYFYELAAGTYVPTSTVITARLAGTISCTGAPVLGLYDLGTSATTAFGSSTQVATLTTGTTDGVYTTTTGSLTFNGQHYYGIGIVSGTCVTAPQIDVTINW